MQQQPCAEYTILGGLEIDLNFSFPAFCCTFLGIYCYCYCTVQYILQALVR